MSNMQPNVIKKTFEEQVALISTMSDVYLDEKQGFELYIAMGNALDYINELEDKVERLTKLTELDNEHIKNLEKTFNDRTVELQEAKLEIKELTERLKEKHIIHIDISEQYRKECEHEIKTAKSDVIKEFAERLKKLHQMPLITSSDIDNLVKEMLGDEE